MITVTTNCELYIDWDGNITNKPDKYNTRTIPEGTELTVVDIVEDDGKKQLMVEYAPDDEREDETLCHLNIIELDWVSGR